MKTVMNVTAAVVVAAAVLVAGTVSTPGPASAAKNLDRDDWSWLCENDQDTYPGQPYVAVEVDTANCREFVVGVDRRPRRFVATVPQAVLDSRQPAPVVFMFHGTTGTGEQYWNISKWRELAVQRGFIAVFPSALSYDVGGSHVSKWNGFNLPCEVVDPHEIADDVAFVDAILADLERQLDIDEHRIYAAGFSSGGGMTQRLAVERADVFAAAGSWAGSLGNCHLERVAPPADPIPVWFGVGSMDDRWMEIGSTAQAQLTEVPADPNTIDLAYDDSLDAWTRAFSLERAISSVQPLSSLATEPPLIDVSVVPEWGPVVVWDDPTRGNTSGNAFYWTTLRGTTHHYPNAWPGARAQTQLSQGVSMAIMHWQFFVDHRKQ